MPMDCDDNDTSRYNLQLAGEGRTRSSSALRPYDFPKFDFDDSLQGHLRFDSLVETEVFLGIQNQEDNQWIEDFSRGSNGMEFNPTPADSCSISRRNNVWSEATSSESVDLLLKSVGQEDMMPGASIIPESEGADDQGSPSKVVETGNKSKERNDAYVASSETISPLDEVLNHHPDSRRHMEELVDPLPTHENVDSNVTQNSLCGNGGTSTNEAKHPYHDGCAVENIEESKAPVDKTLDCGVDRDSSGFSGIADNVISDVVMPSSSKASEPLESIVSNESCGSDGQEKNVSIKKAIEGTDILEGKTGVVSTQICTASSSLGLDPESGRDIQDANLDSVGESKLNFSEGDDQYTSFATSIQTSRHEDVLASSNEGDEAHDNCQGLSSVDGITQQHVAELGSFDSGHCAGTQQKMDPNLQLSHKGDDGHMEDASISPLTGESIPEMPLLPLEDKEMPSQRGDCIGNADNSSSAGDHKDVENVEGCCNDSIVTLKESGARLQAHETHNSIAGTHENLVQRQDICNTAKADKEVSGGNRDIDSENVGTVKVDQMNQLLEISEGVKSDNSICKSQPQTSGELESANNLSPLTTIDASAVPDNRPENGKRELAAIGLIHSDNDCEEAETKKIYDTLGTDDEDTSKAESIVANDIVKILPSEMVAKSQQLVEKADDVHISETLSVEAVHPSCMDHPQAHSDCKYSTKESIDAKLVSVGNVPRVITEEEKASAQTSEVDKASCGSPTIISSSEPLLAEKENEDEEKGHEVTNEFVKDIKSISEDPKRKDLLGDDSSFTFKVNALPDTPDIAPAQSWSPFPDVKKGKVVEETAPSGKAKTERMPSQKTPRQNPRVPEGETGPGPGPGPGTSKGSSERKARRGPGKGMAKENVKKGSHSKGTIQENASRKLDKTSNNMLSTPSSSPHFQFGQMQPYGNLDASNKKPSGAATVPTSGLPDLNSSALNNSTSQSSPFRQPFTDLQQVQLRAQIFVYGSLIQGTAPDETCMVSAFGATDGGRNNWESVWRVAVERVRSQKPSSTAAETPSRSQSGARTLDAAKQGSHSSKVLATPASRASGKDTPAAVSIPMIPLSSPLWNIATPSRDSLTAITTHKGSVVDYQQAFTSVHSFRTPPIKNFVGHTSWPSQTFPGPWPASPQIATFDSSARYQPVTMTETVKLTPVKDTAALLTSSVKHMASSPAVHTESPSPALDGGSQLQVPKTTASGEQHSLDAKPRKRKKVQASNLSLDSLVSESQPEPVVVSDVTTLSPSSVGVSAPVNRVSDVILSKSVAEASRVSSTDHTKKADLDAGKTVGCSEETLSKVAEAKSQAEDAADLATAAVSHCEDLWSQLAKQKDSGLTSESEAKLASAAVAIAAAASVAKAAAAASKIACNAALQAKLMADEAILFGKSSLVLPSSGNSLSDVHDLENATPSSILKSNNVSKQSSSILVAAKEAAKRRVEAASAASRQAENLDAIVKAAELAAAAVSQAGKIVAMGEPLPLNELIEAGPEGYWKLPKSSAVLSENVSDGNMEQSGAVSLEKAVYVPARDPTKDSVEKEGSRNVGTVDVHLSEGLNASLSLTGGIMGLRHAEEKDFRTEIDQKAPETPKSGSKASEPDAFQTSTSLKHEGVESGTHAEDGIKEGSLVEVFKPGNGLKSAWYTANVLSIEDGRAFICYNDLMSEEGSGHLQEWVPLEGEADRAPIIRAANPLSTLQYQQTRKRRRAALGDYAWCVGDRVDVWIDDCWWEGVVTEKDEKDETTLKVNIPAQGETPVVRAWNLRASRSWINGKWIEWSSLRRENASEKSDTPQEKRQKLGTPLVATKAKDKESSKVDSAVAKPQQSKFLNLSTRDRTFDIGKTTNDDNKRAARRPLRTNQQKEGSRVVFGVPKPTGKKRKFMEVSKHFPATKSDKSSEVNDPVKFTKYLIPQGATSRAWKAPSRNDSKEKRPADSRPRVLSTRKAYRTLPQRGNLMSTSAQDADKAVDHGTDVEDSVGRDENTLENTLDHGSIASEEGTEAPLSSLLPHSLSITSKKTSSSHTKTDRLNRGKIVPSGGKLSKIEEDKAYSANTSTSNLDTSEPRRSNRRIQPTHRLLEGLQSSMVIPKMPSASHDKGRRNLPSRGK